MSIQAQIDRIGAEVNSQETLLNYALEALAGKAAGGNSGNGLPIGISGIATGTITIDTQPESLIINHNMGKTPNFLYMVVENALPEIVPNLLLHYFQMMKTHKKVANDGATYQYDYNYCKYYYKTDGTQTTSSGTSTGTIFNDTQFLVAQSSALQNLLPGYTYRWVCLRIDGIE